MRSARLSYINLEGFRGKKNWVERARRNQQEQVFRAKKKRIEHARLMQQAYSREQKRLSREEGLRRAEEEQLVRGVKNFFYGVAVLAAFVFGIPVLVIIW